MKKYTSILVLGAMFIASPIFAEEAKPEAGMLPPPPISPRETPIIMEDK